jgi:dolichol-phosphate mannosyltransferase
LRTLVILPTYNEAENLEVMLRAVRRASPEASVLVIDDGSPDGTGDLGERLGDELGQIKVIRRSSKQGLGSAYRLGFRLGIEQGYDILVEMDSDLSHDPAALPVIIAGVKKGSALTIGSRYVPGGTIPSWSWHRRKLSRWGNLYAQRLLKFPAVDSTSGFRAYRAAIVDDIDLTRVRADGYAFQVEMAYRVHMLGGEISEVPISFRDRELGESKMSSRIVLEALLLITWWGVRDRAARRKPKAMVEFIEGTTTAVVRSERSAS